MLILVLLWKITEKPIILYSIPSRCGIEISTDVVCRLKEKFPHVCALKEAGGRSAKVSETMIAIDENFVVLSGDDGLSPFLLWLVEQRVLSVWLRTSSPIL